MKLGLAGLVILVSFSCQRKKENSNVSQLRELLPQIEMPLKFNSAVRVKYKTVDLPDNSLIKKLNERSPFSVIGKVFENDANITILGYTFEAIGTPILITFDRDGNEISSHAVFETAMSELGHHTVNVVNVFPNRQILFTDSTVLRKLNEGGMEEVIGSDSLLLTLKRYLISHNGTIETIE